MVKKKIISKTYPKGYGLTSLILAILGFFLLLIFPQISLVLFLIGGIFGYLHKKTDKTNFVLNIVGFIISIIWVLLAYLVLLPLIAGAYGGVI